MENASKALIIAGAILISIVLVTVGVLVVNNLNPEDATSQMDQQAKDTFNQKFVSVSGENVSGTNVKTLISSIISNNATNEGEDTKTIYVKVGNNINVTGWNSAGETESSKLSLLRNKINSQHKYTVLPEYEAGLVHVITITDNAK